MKKLTMLIMATCFAMYGEAQTAYNVSFTMDFENPTVSDNWTMVSNNTTNYWMIGSATGNIGNSLYISNDGINNAYSHVTTYATAYITVDFGNFAEYVFSFDWAVLGQTSTTDRVGVFIIPEYMDVPTTWTATSTGWITGEGVFPLYTSFYGQSTWQHSTTVIPGSTVANTTKKIVFMFYCNTATGSAPVAIDNISIEGNTCATPTAVRLSNATLTSAAFYWTAAGAENAWNVIVSDTIVTDFSSAASTATNSNALYTEAGLNSGTLYYAYVQADCGTSDGTSDWTQPMTFFTLCPPVTSLPWRDSFDGTLASSNIPGCWTVVQPYGAYPQIVAAQSYSAPNSLQFLGMGGSSPSTTVTATPAFAAELSTLEISFLLRKGSATSGTFEVGVMSDISDPSTFTSIQNVTLTTNTTWLAVNVSLANAPSNCHYIAFKHYGLTGILTGSYWLDDVKVEYLPTCSTPTDVVVSNEDVTTADISWTAGGSETAWNVLVSDTAVMDFSSVISTATNNNPYTATGLSPNTLHYVYVQADCSAAGIGTSNWTNAASFRTVCDSISALPWLDNFDSYTASLPDCWTRVQSYLVSPRIVTDNYFSASKSLIFNGSQTEMMATPKLAADVSTLEVSFWLKMQSSTLSGMFEVGVMSNVSDASNFEPIRDVTLVDVNSWVYCKVPLKSASNGNHFIAFRQSNTSASASYWLDDVDVHLLPPCFIPTDVTTSNLDLTSTEIIWTAGDSETAWNVIVSDTVVTDFGSIVPIATTDNHYTATNLIPSTLYYVYVQADCGETDGTSEWTNVTAFRTLCEVITAMTWSENFDGFASGEVPTCWTQVQTYQSGSGGNSYPRVSTTHSHSASKSLQFYGFQPQMIATPEFAEEANIMDVKFWLYKDNTNSGTFEIGVMSNVLDTSTFMSISYVEQPATPWYHVEISLAEVPAGYHYVAFRQKDATLFYYYFLDDIEIISTPVVSPVVTTLEADNIRSSMATLHKAVTAGSRAIASEGFKYRAIGATTWINRITSADDAYLTALTPSTAYEFFAYAETVDGQITGDTLTFTTLGTPPTVTTMEATAITQTTATLNKTVIVGTEPVTTEGFGYKAAEDINWIDVTNGNLTDLLVNTAYKFYAFATTANDTFTGDTLTFTTHDENVGYDTANANEFIIYPNPTNSIVTVMVEGLRTSAKVTVTDINGKLIETLTINTENNKAEFDVANYADGTYLIKVVSDNINRVEKLIVKK